MSDVRITRFMGWLGLLTLIAFFIGFGVLSGNNQPNENASGATVVTWVNAHQSMRWAQIYVIGVALTLTLLFVVQLSHILHDALGGKHFWPNVVFAAGIIFVAGEVVGGGIDATVLNIAAHNHQFLIAQQAHFIGQNNEIVMIYGLALLTLASGIAILSGSTLPTWLGIVSVVIGVLCVLGPIGLLGTLLAAVWLPVTGFVVASKAKNASTTAGVESPMGIN